MKLRKVLAITLALSMTFSLAACGGSDEGAVEAPAADTGEEEAPAADAGEEAAPAAEASGLTYASINLGEDYKDLSTTIKFIHHKTDREEDGTMADLPTYFVPYGTVDEMSEYVNFADQWKDAEGNCYGIGYMGNAQGVLYNKKVFADAGVTELPKTPDEFIAALQAIKDNTDAIPLYTNYAAGWTMGGQWDAYLGAITTGDETWLNQKFVHTAEPFKDNGDGTGAYALYKILYDATAQGLIEEDYTTTDWEGGYPISKTAPTSFVFDGVTVVNNLTSLPGEEDFMNEMNAESELSFNAGGDAKIQAIVEAAFTGTQTYDEIMADWTTAWNAAQEACEIEVLY